jgi:hypothetical protein
VLPPEDEKEEDDDDDHIHCGTISKSFLLQDCSFYERLWIASQNVMSDTDVHIEDDAADTRDNGEMRSKKDHVVN